MNLTTTLLAAAIASVGVSASAATVFNGGSLSAGDLGVGNTFLDAGNSTFFTFTAATDLEVLDFVSVSSVGFSGGSDLALVNFGNQFTGESSNYTAFTQNGATTEANSSLSGFTLLAGQSFTLFFDYNAAGANTTSNQFSFATIEIAPVPLPAGLVLMGTALGGLGLMRRRNAKASA